MRVLDLHSWDLTPREARVVQDRLREQLDLTDRFDPSDIRLVAGVDNTYRRRAGVGTAYSVVVVLSFPDLDRIEEAAASQPISFPYMPGLLAFREAPAVVEAARKTRSEPDVVLVDGHGYAHPRRFGFASHLGVLLDRPTIGCAKSVLVGQFDEPAQAFGARTPLIDRGEVIGAAVRTRPGHKPLFVSCGNRISLDTAVELALACCRAGRFLPEPTGRAHTLINEVAGPTAGT